MRGVLIVCAVAASLLVGCFGQSFSDRLEDSLGDELESRLVSCKPNKRHGGYRCAVEIDPYSGYGAVYAVHRVGDDCWEAVRREKARRRNGDEKVRPVWLPPALRAVSKVVEGCV
jgi:hypothetical protein